MNQTYANLTFVNQKNSLYQCLDIYTSDLDFKEYDSPETNSNYYNDFELDELRRRMKMKVKTEHGMKMA